MKPAILLKKLKQKAVRDPVGMSFCSSVLVFQTRRSGQADEQELIPTAGSPCPIEVIRRYLK
jgi:hypothetical protein